MLHGLNRIICTIHMQTDFHVCTHIRTLKSASSQRDATTTTHYCVFRQIRHRHESHGSSEVSIRGRWRWDTPQKVGCEGPHPATKCLLRRHDTQLDGDAPTSLVLGKEQCRSHGELSQSNHVRCFLPGQDLALN